MQGRSRRGREARRPRATHGSSGRLLSQVGYLLDASDGRSLRTIDVGNAVFAQPVFAGAHLFVADRNGTLTTYA